MHTMADLKVETGKHLQIKVSTGNARFVVCGNGLEHVARIIMLNRIARC